MLPDIRAVIAAIMAAVGLLMVSFGVVANLRVAQQQQSISLQADLATRGRPVAPAPSGERAILLVDTPGPHVIPQIKSAAPESALTEKSPPAPAAPAVAAQAVPREPPVVATLPPAEAPQATSPAEPPIGRPFTEPPRVQTETPRGDFERAATVKARKLRAARIARERRTARRAAQSRRAKPQSDASFGTPNSFRNINQFGGTFRQ